MTHRTIREATREQLEALAQRALEIAVAAPPREGMNNLQARVPWATVNAVREAAEAIGFDWRDGVRKYRMIERHRRWLRIHPANRGPEPPLP